MTRIQYENLTIRQAEVADVKQLAAWWNDGLVMAHAGFPNGLGTTEDEIIERLGKGRMVIEENNCLIGECNYREVNDGVAEIGIKICETDCQNRGVGKKALSMLIGWLFRNGYSKIVLDTNLRNTRAQHVYESLGFRKVRINIDSWKDQLGRLQSSVDYELVEKDFVSYISDVLQIEGTLRLRRFDGYYDFAFEWYQDPETVHLVDGKAEPYSYETLTNMYNYLNSKGELYFIEVSEEGKWKPIGDVTFWQEDMHIVIGEREYRGKGIGKKVVSALVDRGRMMGYDKLYVGEIYDFNVGSRKCFEGVGFCSYEKTEKGARYVLRINNPDEIISKMKIFSLTDKPILMPFKNVEDGAEYDVWLVETQDKKYVLKKAKNKEIEINSSFFANKINGAPRFIDSVNYNGADYFLMEYAEGKDMCRAERKSLKKALDALISLQDRYWNDHHFNNVGLTFTKSLEGRRERGKYLNDPDLEAAYGDYLSVYSQLPRTLCHDDLLPFNLLIDDAGATIIDWEVAGILPYPTSIARLLAHAEENDDPLFYMSNEDKKFAIEYYYTNFISHKGITHEKYIYALDLFFLYEYCEWIMLGNKYKNADMKRYKKYLDKARRHIKKQ